MSDMERVIEKIAKIQRLAENGGTPEEAAVAASKVQELLSLHGLEMAQIDLAAGLPTLSGYGHQKYEVVGTWQQSLLNHICRNNNCKLILVGAKVGDIIGHKDNVVGVMGLFDWLVEEIERMSNEAWKREGAEQWESARKWKGSYRAGAVQTIAARLSAERMEREAQLNQNHSKALIAIDNKVAEVTRDLYPRTGTRSHRVSRGAGFASGQRDAAGMSLGRRQGISAGRARIA